MRMYRMRMSLTLETSATWHNWSIDSSFKVKCLQCPVLCYLPRKDFVWLAWYKWSGFSREEIRAEKEKISEHLWWHQRVRAMCRVCVLPIRGRMWLSSIHEEGKKKRDWVSCSSLVFGLWVSLRRGRLSSREKWKRIQARNNWPLPSWLVSHMKATSSRARASYEFYEFSHAITRKVAQASLENPTALFVSFLAIWNIRIPFCAPFHLIGPRPSFLFFLFH